MPPDAATDELPESLTVSDFQFSAKSRIGPVKKPAGTFGVMATTKQTGPPEADEPRSC
jgi:hypothetical protein